MIEMVQARPAKKKLYEMRDGTKIEATSFEEALKIYKYINEKN